MKHKDGSVFPVDFSISKFSKDNTTFYSGRIRRVDEREAPESGAGTWLGQPLRSNSQTKPDQPFLYPVQTLQALLITVLLESISSKATLVRVVMAR